MYRGRNIAAVLLLVVCVFFPIFLSANASDRAGVSNQQQALSIDNSDAVDDEFLDLLDYEQQQGFDETDLYEEILEENHQKKDPVSFIHAGFPFQLLAGPGMQRAGTVSTKRISFAGRLALRTEQHLDPGRLICAARSYRPADCLKFYFAIRQGYLRRSAHFELYFYKFILTSPATRMHGAARPA